MECCFLSTEAQRFVLFTFCISALYRSIMLLYVHAQKVAQLSRSSSNYSASSVDVQLMVVESILVSSDSLRDP